MKLLKAMFAAAPRVAPSECRERVRAGRAIVIDVREPGEWQEGVVEGAVLLPLSDLSGPRARWQEFLAGTGDRELLLYCASGGRSGIAARLLAAEGRRAVNAGGLRDWAAAGWPISPPAG